jgi:hypothetical protein
VANYVSGTKVYIVFLDHDLNFYESPFDRKPFDTLKCNEILKVEDAVFDMIEIPMETLVITLKSGIVRRLAWGEDSKSLHTYWRKVLGTFLGN